jgi:ureidoglycolate hydrolase
LKILRLNHKSIRPFGCLIDAKCVTYKSGDNGFGIVFREKSVGWRIAYLVVRKRTIARLESHPNTAETFEPVKGSALLVLAPRNRPDDYSIFLLDRPVIVKRGIWHNIASVTGPCEIKICEAIRVVEAYHALKNPIAAREAA